jgi:GH15 family glucan-1,4-alpha-glucosidase
MSSTPIADHALLSDCHSAALVSRQGSVEWLCFPRFDSPSVFGRLLDDEAGHWSIRPAADFRVTRRYLDKTMVLETTFATAAGSVTIVDALALGANKRGHDLGRNAPSLLIRQVVGVTGEVELEMEYVPRTEYGLIWPLLAMSTVASPGAAGPTLRCCRRRLICRSAPVPSWGASASQRASVSRSGCIMASLAGGYRRCGRG